MNYFDHLQKDEGYVAVIENHHREMLSSHAVKRFAANSAFYYCMLISFFLFETYKEDVLQGIVPITSYATTIRRQVVDWAAKIIRRGGQIILKVTQAVMTAWHVDELWVRCQNPPPIVV